MFNFSFGESVDPKNKDQLKMYLEGEIIDPEIMGKAIEDLMKLFKDSSKPEEEYAVMTPFECMKMEHTDSDSQYGMRSFEHLHQSGNAKLSDAEVVLIEGLPNSLNSRLILPYLVTPKDTVLYENVPKSFDTNTFLWDCFSLMSKKEQRKLSPVLFQLVNNDIYDPTLRCDRNPRIKGIQDPKANNQTENEFLDSFIKNIHENLVDDPLRKIYFVTSEERLNSGNLASLLDKTHVKYCSMQIKSDYQMICDEFNENREKLDDPLVMKPEISTSDSLIFGVSINKIEYLLGSKSLYGDITLKTLKKINPDEDTK